MPTPTRAPVVKPRVLAAVLGAWLAFAAVRAVGLVAGDLAAAGPGAVAEAVTLTEAARIRRALDRAAPPLGADPAAIAALDAALRARAPLDATVVLLGPEAHPLEVWTTFLRVLWMPRTLYPMLALPDRWVGMARARPGPTWLAVLRGWTGPDLAAEATLVERTEAWTLWRLDEEGR
ncbi:MAG: hypothetical protein R3F30_06675 [Planctomycetota bacterium]